MFRPTHAAALLALLLTAACGEDARQPKSTDEVIAEAGELETPQPGQYETTVALLDFSVPGLPASQADKIKSMMGADGEQTNSFCLTAEEARKGFGEQIRKMSQGRLDCTFDEFEVDDGALAAEMSCKGPQGMDATMVVDGTAGATRTSMTVALTQKAPMIPGGEMRMTMKMDSQRTSDCG